MSQLNAAERRFLETATLIGAQRAIFGKLSSVGVRLRDLGEVADTTSGGTPDRNNPSYYGGRTPWLKSGELTDGLVTEIEETLSEEGLANTNAKVIPKGTLLIALYGATVGKTGILGLAAATNQAVCAITPKTDEVKTSFLYWFLRYKREDFLQSSFGGAQPNISQRILRKTPVPLPSQPVQENISEFLSAVEQRMRGSKMELPPLLPPLTQQRRVVARIEELAAQIHEARTLRYEATEEAEAFRGAGRNSFFNSAATEFGAARLEGLSSRVTKGESPEWQGFTYHDTGPLFIRSENVLWGSLAPRNAVHIPQAFHEKLSRCQLHENDVLINLVGASIGRACAVPAGLGAANVNQAVGVITPDTDRLLPHFLVHYLLSPIAQDIIHAGKVETARPNISLGDVRGLEIPTPPLPEQRRIVAELDALQAEVDALKRLQTETAAELDALLPSILDRAFKGEL